MSLRGPRDSLFLAAYAHLHSTLSALPMLPSRAPSGSERELYQLFDICSILFSSCSFSSSTRSRQASLSSRSGHELLLRYCEVCAAEFAPIVDDMLALELYEPHKSRMRAVHGCWKWAHTITSDRPQITFLTCGLWRSSHSRG